MKKSNQSGFAALEAVLIVIILAILGFTGWYVWHSKQATDKTLNNASNFDLATPAKQVAPVTTFAECEKAADSRTLQTAPEQCVTKAGKTFTDIITGQSQKYLDIKEWDVNVAYGGNDTLSYKIDSTIPDTATIISANLAAQYDCTTMGAGQIERFTPDQGTYSDGTGPTASQAAASNPSLWGHVGRYYYQFVHDQAACPNTANSDTVAVQTAQNAANSFVQALVPKLQAD